MTESSRKRDEDFPEPVLDDFDDLELAPPPLPKTPKRSKTSGTSQSRKIVNPSNQTSRNTLLLVSGASGVVLLLLSVLLFLQLQSNSKPVPDADSIAKSDVNPRSSGLVESSSHDAPSSNESSKLQEAGNRLASRQSAIVENPRVPSADEPDEPEPESKPSSDSEAMANDEKMTDEEKMANAEPLPESPSNSPDNSATPEQNPANPTRADLDSLISVAASLVKTAQGEDAAARFKEAATTLRKASNLYPKDIRGDFYLGLLHSGIGINNYKVAEQHFKRALDRVPGHVPTMNNLALVAIKAHKFPTARNYLGLLAKENPRPFEANQNLGRLLNQAKYLEIKTDELKRISMLNSESAVHRPDLGWMYMPLDNSEKAIAEYKGFCRDGNLEDPSCSTCNGFGSIPCKACGREGTVLVMGSISGTQSTLYGSVNTTTPTSASVRCNNCGGKGRVDCVNCSNGNDPGLKRRR